MIKQQIILFDGQCNLCNKSVQFVLKRDTKAIFTFASLQSEFGQKFLQERNLPADDFDSFILFIPKEAFYTKSTAFLKMYEQLGLRKKLTAKVLSYFPTSIRDSIYSFIAQNRYKWFGKTETCLLPKPEWKSRFIE